MKTVEYYDNNAKDYTQDTVLADVISILDRFNISLEKQAYTLDFGCGSGRDSKYFLERGFRVDSTDGSKEMCRIASEYIGQEVKKCYLMN